MEINMFCHFGPNTFTGAEWGSGEENKAVFAPSALDCRQWVDIAKQAGMGGIILTAKHHDGFCLWPSKYSTHTVDDSNNVLRQFVDACREGNIKAGVYISPWDRNHPTYGTDDYNNVFVNTLHEVHTNYGPFFEQWFDGACGEGPNGKKQCYDWSRFMQTMHNLNPQAIIFSDIGPGCRWVGNEEGHCGDPCWSTLNTDGATPSDNKPDPSELETGHKGGAKWVPAEVDVSIRPGWFWHANEHPKNVDQLMEIYYNSVGRNGLLLLNVPPDTNGRIPAEDSAVLMAFHAERDRIFSHDMTQGAKVRALGRPGHKAANVLDTAYHSYWAALSKDPWISIELDSVTDFDIIVIQEYIPLGQRVTSVQLWTQAYDDLYPYTNIDNPLCTTVGYKRIIRCNDNPRHWSAKKIVLHFQGDAAPIINRIALYNSKAQ
ncbi:MAG: alpha-L-fucosidase [Bacteroidales bacterium]|nr:alpha-L-fucosidase [Bacteroidales bacterium]